MSVTEFMPLLQTGLTVGGTLVVAMGTWYFNEKSRTDKSKKENEERIAKLNKDINDTLEANRNEYLDQINDVHKSINSMKAEYDKSTTVLSMQISALEKKQDVHNDVITRTFLVEKDIEVLKNRESVSEHRLDDLERHEEMRKA